MIKVLCVGSMKDQHLSAIQEDYLKRVNRFHKVEVVEVKEANPSFEDEKIIEVEGEGLLKNIKPTDFVVTLDLQGKMLDSVSLSEWIEQKLSAHSNLVFVIGGSLGLSKSVKQRADASLCFSKLTFPHLLIRVFLLEQLFRSYKILNHQVYHK